MDERVTDCRRSLGVRIRELRELQGLSLRRFALMVGMDYTYLHSIEHAGSAATVDMLVRIADGLGVSVSDLIDF